MAAIDKIYGTTKQYDELFAWLVENYPDFCKFMYARPEEDAKNAPLANFPIEVDGTLYLVCPLEWVNDRISTQYGIYRR
jgi:hypothetical protein